MTSQILALRDHLIAERITCAVMEATSDYWKPFYYLLEDAGFDVLLVNARHVKNLPGRKTDVADATWLAQLGAHGLVRASFVPPEPIRQLRDLTRARTAITRERSREVQRLEKVQIGGIGQIGFDPWLCRRWHFTAAWAIYWPPQRWGTGRPVKEVRQPLKLQA